MNGNIKERWITALESGKYSQSHRTLADANGFCCLGVLCEIAMEDSVVNKEIIPDGTGNFFSKYEGPDDYSTSMLPEDVQVWAGIDKNPFFPNEDVKEVIGEFPEELTGYGAKVSLAALNDSGLSFTEIAKVIRELL